MNKKKLAVIFAFILILQLVFPIGSIIKYKSSEINASKKGETFKIKLHSATFYNKNYEGDEAYLEFTYNDYVYYSEETVGQKYAMVSTGENGYAKFEFCAEKPKTENYIKGEKKYWYFSFPEHGMTMHNSENLEMVYFISDDDRFSITPDGYIDVGVDEIYLEAKIYNGKMIPISVYIDGDNANNVLKFYDDNFDALVSERLSDAY